MPKIPLETEEDNLIDVWAVAEVVPGSVTNPYLKGTLPGYSSTLFGDDLQPVSLNVKAGTAGTITITVNANYRFFEDKGAYSKILYQPKTGTVQSSCTW